ncbi:MAG: GAF domain-containing protein, partial [Anaerolineales bacterium]|nr:GAF domain-containing protein [Anaerolineales bacterium]
ALVLLVFPLFFRRALVAPLKNLMAGMKWINQGELETAVPIQYNDEIGYLTRSFNTLMETLKQSQNQQTMLFAQLQASYDELEARITDRTQELSAFTDLTMLPGEQESLTDILQPALTHIIEIGLCQALSVHLLAEDQQALVLAAQRFLPETAVHTQTAIPLSSPFDARFKQIDAPLLIRPNSEQPLLPAEFKIHDYPIYLGSPLTAGNQVHGWLSCYRAEAREFTMGEISLLVALARQMGIIVENYQLRERIQQVAAYDERKRLARDLHDSVTQLLYSMTLFTRVSEEAVEDGDNVRLAFSLERLSDISQQALREMRFLLFELQPPSLEEMGLNQALDARFDMVERRLGVRVLFEADQVVSPSKEVDNELYFVAIEALNNSIKHGDATQVHLEIKNEEDCICLIVADNGRGFDLSQVTHGMGLSNMHHRAESLAGTLTIESASNTGTKVTMTVPVSKLLQNNL